MTTSKLDEALWLAASECRAQKVKNLIARGADPNIKIGGMSPIQVAISKVRTRQNEFRNNRWIDIHFRPLETVKAILEAGVSVEVFNGALIYASKIYEDEDISELLLAYTHDANQRANQTESALKRARQIVKKLLDDEDAKVGTQPEQDLQRRERREELESKRRSILESRWRMPNVKRTASSTSFEDAKKELQSLCEFLEPSIQGTYSEFISYAMQRSDVTRLVETHQ